MQQAISCLLRSWRSAPSFCRTVSRRLGATVCSVPSSCNRAACCPSLQWHVFAAGLYALHAAAVLCCSSSVCMPQLSQLLTRSKWINVCQIFYHLVAFSSLTRHGGKISTVSKQSVSVIIHCFCEFCHTVKNVSEKIQDSICTLIGIIYNLLSSEVSIPIYRWRQMRRGQFWGILLKV